MMNITTALEIVGGLSSPSKMPCHGYSIPAQKCMTGSKLRNVKGSVCNLCYALKGRYAFQNVKTALYRRFESLTNPQWIEAMIYLITNKEKSGFFRWHDSGDIQNLTHLDNIVTVCKATPNVTHWLPTREYKLVSDYINQGNTIPPNLIIRLSAYMLEGKPPTEIANRLGVFTSGVSKTSFNCPAPKQGNVCGDCRACWNKNVSNVSYKQH